MTYSDHRNSITPAYANGEANEYTSIGGWDAFHDANRNLSQQIIGITGAVAKAYVYECDPDNRLETVACTQTSETDITVGEFDIDALGRLIRSQTRFDCDTEADSETLNYFYDGQNVIAEVESAGPDYPLNGVWR